MTPERMDTRVEPHGLPLRLRDINLFRRSARSDASLGGMRGAEAFERLYAEAPGNDPWASADTRYLYQRRKYERILSLLPPGRSFARALDLGCGLGLLAERVAPRCRDFLGIDLSATALERARLRLGAALPHARFEQGDATHLPAAFEGRFDLVLAADVIYYLPPGHLTDAGLKALVTRLARLLTPDGLLLVANHDFARWDADTRLSRRIHAALRWCPGLRLAEERRFAFFRASLLQAGCGGEGG